jgi:choline kinase
MKKIHVIMAMAGEGKRFSAAGIDSPKPLIEYKEKPLFVNAMSSLNGIDVASWTFIVRQEHIDKFHIDDVIYKYYKNANIVSVKKTTRGAADTANLGITYLLKSWKATPEDSVVIMDCDVVVDAEQWKDVIKTTDDAGVLLSFKSTDTRFSYISSKNDKVLSTAEKIVISDNAITSPYFINKIKYFTDAFQDMYKCHTSDNELTYKEMYMSILYNFIIAQEHKVTYVAADKVTSLGTPEELNTVRA